jgi:hypothetical protein
MIRLPVLVVLGVSLLLASTALAESTPVTIEDASPSLEAGKDGGYTSALALTNQTDDKVDLTVKAGDAADEGCKPTVKPKVLPPPEQRRVLVTIPAGCTVGDNGFNYKLTATPDTGSPLTLNLIAAPKPKAEEKPEWGALKAFPYAAIGLFVFAVLIFFGWARVRGSTYVLTDPLNHLDASWSFKDSWVSNVTVAGALLTGIFGSADVVKAVIGEDADSSIALATVGGAVAIAFIGAAPIILLSTVTKTDHVENPGDTATSIKPTISVWGLLLASSVLLAGAFGQLWVMYRSGTKLDLGGFDDGWLLVVFVVPAALLAVYALRTLIATLDAGTPPPAKAPDTDAVRAARQAFTAAKRQAAIGDVYGEPVRRRSAMF